MKQMIRGIIFFLLVWAASCGVISLIRNASGRERLQVAKLLIYGGVNAILALLIVVGIVIIF